MNSTTQLQRNQAVAVTIKLEEKGTIQLSNKKADPPKADFDSLFIEAVDSTLSMLGDPTKKTLYLHLKNTHGITKETIPQNIEVFANILEQVFGQKALILETRIMETLHSKVPMFRFSPKQGELSFLDYLQSFRCFLFLQSRHEKIG